MAKNVNNIKSNKERPEAEPNPCSKEQEMSYACMDKHNYDGSKCVIHFENYNTCKSFWNTIRIERMRNGREPYIPREEERKKILEERFTGKKTL